MNFRPSLLFRTATEFAPRFTFLGVLLGRSFAALGSFTARADHPSHRVFVAEDYLGHEAEYRYAEGSKSYLPCYVRIS